LFSTIAEIRISRLTTANTAPLQTRRKY